MSIKLKALILVLISYIEISTAQINEPNNTIIIQTYNQNGPNDCLLNSTDKCPVDFLIKVFCLHDEAICINSFNSDNPRLRNQQFWTKYGHLLSDFDPNNIAYSHVSVLNLYPEETIHELFEYIICDLSEESCYAEGFNGLTIYSDDTDCFMDDDFCGGPTDSAVCQVTPEACSGNTSAN